MSKDIFDTVGDSPEHEKREMVEGWWELFVKTWGAFENPESTANRIVLNVAADGTTIVLEASNSAHELGHLTAQSIDLVNQLTKIGANGYIQAIYYAKWMLFTEHIGWNIFSAGLEHAVELMRDGRGALARIPAPGSGTAGVLRNPAPFHAYGIHFGPRSTIMGFAFQVGWRASHYTWQMYGAPGISDFPGFWDFSQPSPDTDLQPVLLKRDTSEKSEEEGVELSFETSGRQEVADSLHKPSTALATSTALTTEQPPSDLEGGKKTRKRRRKKNKTKHKRSKRRKSLKKRRKKKRTRKY